MLHSGKISKPFHNFKPLVLLLCLIFYVTFHPQTLVTEAQVPVDCEDFFFLNAVWINFSNTTETLYLESPVNFTLGSTINQTVETLLTKNVVFNFTANAFEFNITRGGEFYGYLINKVRTCYPRSTWSRSLLYTALSNVSYQPSPWNEIPSEVAEKYIRQQNPAVVNVVVPQYEAWFQHVYGIPVENASALGLASSAAWFVYTEFIEYDPSAEPRTIEEVIQSRRGDCDDMSRILVELLNYYGIPATIGYGYVYIRDDRFSRFEMPVENMTYIFRFNGPHAFALAYIPGIEWISIDWLAGSLWHYPFLFEGESRETVVNESEVEQMVELHRSINGTQLIAVFTQVEFTSLFGLELNVELVEDFVNRTISGGSITTTLTTTTQSGYNTVTPTITTHETNTTSEQGLKGDEDVGGFTIIALAVLFFMGVAILIARYFLKRR